jgi:biopolymer transport protein ExbD
MGARLGGGGPRGAIVDINITPFVDIVLVVLIIFMVTSSVVNAREDLPITLPEAASGEPADEETSLAVVITRDGAIELDGARTSLTELRARIRSEKDAGHEVTALLSGVREARHGAVVDVLDAVRLEGVTNFAFEIQPPRAP